MKIEVGKLYKNRCGEKIKIYCVNAGGDYPIHGACLKDGVWEISKWASQGFFVSPRNPSIYDIQDEWEEPTKKMRAFIDPSKEGCVFLTSEVSVPSFYKRAYWLDEP